MNELIAVLIMFGGAGLVVVLMMGLNQWLGPKKRNPVKDEIFECGNIPVAGVANKFSVKFYTVAILFILFDIEPVFLFPLAVVFQSIGIVGFVFMTLFISVLILGLVYIMKKVALEWD